MTKCRQNVHHGDTRSGRQIPPVVAQQAALATTSSSDSARGHLTVFSTTPFSDVLQEIMTETGFPGRTSSEACGRSILGSILGRF